MTDLGSPHGAMGIMGGIPHGFQPHENGINQQFDYHIRDQRGRFTPGGSLLIFIFGNFIVFELFHVLDILWFRT